MREGTCSVLSVPCRVTLRLQPEEEEDSSQERASPASKADAVEAVKKADGPIKLLACMSRRLAPPLGAPACAPLGNHPGPNIEKQRGSGWPLAGGSEGQQIA